MAGAGYKLFNTGDVLTAAQVNTYLMEQTVMVFANAAARTTALSGVVSEGMISYLKDTNAVEVYDGSNWVSSDDPNAIQNTIVDAKGDLIAASAADTPARLAVGNNGETLVADSSATTGLRWTATPAASNPVLNSSFDIWQRGTSLSGTASISNYTADRWIHYAASANTTISRQATGDTTNLPFIQYCARVQRTAGNTATGEVQILQPFETTNAIPFAGKTVTLSFYARRGANYSGGSNNITVQMNTGTGTDQNPYSSYTGDTSAILSTATLTTTWQRFTYTATLGANITEFYIMFKYSPTGTAGAADLFEVTGVQLDIGNTALPYRRNSATLAGELAAAMRYYQRVTGSTVTAGICGSTTISYFTYASQVPFRKTTLSLTQAGYGVSDFSGGYWDTGTIAIGGNAEDAIGVGRVQLTYTHGTAVFTQYRPCLLAPSGSTAYLAISAEL